MKLSIIIAIAMIVGINVLFTKVDARRNEVWDQYQVCIDINNDPHYCDI